MTHVLINVRSIANTKKARKETRNGREYVIVPSATLPDNVVMNGIKYPAEEIEASYKGLERTPAPLGHPMVNGKFVSAKDPEGIAAGWIGAWNENVTRKNGRVFLDKVIDVANASQSEGGKRVLAAIEAGTPIHTSTGLFADVETLTTNGTSEKIARSIRFDHDAILLDEAGAATPEQGVGMFVNKDGAQEEVEVINSSIEEADRDLDWAIDSLARALEKRQKAPIIDRIKTKLLEMFGVEREVSVNNGKEDEMPDEKQVTDLSAKVDALTEAVGKIGESVALAIGNALKPLVDEQAARAAQAKAAEDAEKAELVNKVVAANVLSKESAEGLTVNALRELAPKAAPAAPAAPLNNSFKAPAAGKAAEAFKLPKGE